jgi:hypothetical protein
VDPRAVALRAATGRDVERPELESGRERDAALHAEEWRSTPQIRLELEGANGGCLHRERILANSHDEHGTLGRLGPDARGRAQQEGDEPQVSCRGHVRVSRRKAKYE